MHHLKPEFLYWVLKYNKRVPKYLSFKIINMLGYCYIMTGSGLQYRDKSIVSYTDIDRQICQSDTRSVEGMLLSRFLLNPGFNLLRNNIVRYEVFDIHNKFFGKHINKYVKHYFGSACPRCIGERMFVKTIYMNDSQDINSILFEISESCAARYDVELIGDKIYERPILPRKSREGPHMSFRYDVAVIKAFNSYTVRLRIFRCHEMCHEIKYEIK